MRKIFLLSSLLIFICSNFAIALQDRQEKYNYDSRGKRDPFFRLQDDTGNNGVTAVVSTLSPLEKLKKKGIVVSSIVWDENTPAILINDDILEIGDTIQGVIIRDIAQDYVVFEIDGELVEVPL